MVALESCRVTRQRGRTIEIETLADFDRYSVAGAVALDGWHFQAVDLSERTDVLASLTVAGSLFLGCSFAAGVEDDLRARGALLFPELPDVPVDVYRASLYTPQELYDGLESSYQHTLDARAYGWSQGVHSPSSTLAQTLHDYAIDEALHDYVEGRSLVGMMGGHALARSSQGYSDAARLAQTLGGHDFLVCTGGGPGAMEAANLGAYLAGYDDSALTEAIALLSQVPDFVPSIGDWASVAFEVLSRWDSGTASLGVPTWHYGHEPPNAFATEIAKYFKNAIREDVLLNICSAGIVFLPGAGGTVQEIFADACENFYADPATVAPMVLVGRDYWTNVVPAWQLLQSLAQGRSMETVVHLVDDLDEVAALLGG